MRAIASSCERHALSGGRSRGRSQGVALGFLLGMAAISLFLAVVVEGYSMRVSRTDAHNMQQPTGPT